MKQLLAVSILFGVISCTSETVPTEPQIEDQLLNGEWRVQASEKPFEGFQKGMKFSKDRQVFFLDSQFKTIPTSNKIIYEVDGDTLKIVDYKYDSKFLYQRGTQIFTIKELSDDTLKLEMIHPKPKNIIVLKNVK
jgi:hypothetical protein